MLIRIYSYELELTYDRRMPKVTTTRLRNN